MTKILCDQCGSECNDCDKHLQIARVRWDFCSSECFWKWVEEKKPKAPPTEDYRLMQCRRCEGQGWNQNEGTCTLCNGAGFVPFLIGQLTP